MLTLLLFIEIWNLLQFHMHETERQHDFKIEIIKNFRQNRTNKFDFRREIIFSVLFVICCRVSESYNYFTTSNYRLL